METTHDTLAVIGAFLDHERIDPDALIQALSSDEGRRYLVDVVVLREITANQTMWSEPRALPNRRAYRAWIVMVATVTVCVAGGYAAGQQRAAERRPADPLRPSMELTAIPVVPVAPPATRVITLEPGVNWHEEMGGGD